MVKISIVRQAKNIGNFFKTRAILKTLGIILALYGLFVFSTWLPSLQIRPTPLPEVINTPLSPSIGYIYPDAGITLVAETDNRRLYINPATLNLIVEDIGTGHRWHGIQENSQPEFMSLFEIEFVSRDDVEVRWDSFTHSVNEGHYLIEHIKNGVRITSFIQNSEPTDIDIFMPRLAPIDRFEYFFVDGINRLLYEGIITDEQAMTYRSTLDLVYAKDEEGGFYFNRLQHSPPMTALRQLLSLVRRVGYTLEDLQQDEEPFNLPVQVRRPPAGFTIPIEFTLENDDFIARLITENIYIYNDFFTPTRIRLLPNFGAVTVEDVQEGFIFVPDGAGALIRLNSFDPNFGSFERPLYNNTKFRDRLNFNQFPEDLHMPVFGMTDDDNGVGFLAIIENGDDTAFISAHIGASRLGQGGNLFNRVSSGFDIMQFHRMSITGATETGGSFIVGTGVMDIEYTVRYQFFTGGVTYFDFAQAYRNFLVDRYQLNTSFPTDPGLFLEFIGTVSIEGRFLGQAYERRISLTEYHELQDILLDLSDITTVVLYNGVFNNGQDSRLGNRANLVRENGSQREFEALMETAKKTGTDLFLGVNLARVYVSGNGFRERTHAARRFDGEVAEFSEFSPVFNTFRPLSTRYTLLNPLFIPTVVDDFVQASDRHTHIMVNDLGRDFLASYRRGAVIPPRQASYITQEALHRLASVRTVALYNPNMPYVPFADLTVNISRESSNFGAFYTSVPFRQIVFNGLVPHTTLNINMSGFSPDYFLLQALETGSMPKFQLTAKNTHQLHHTRHTSFMSTEYAMLRGEIFALYERYTQAFKEIGCFEIVNHEMISTRVFTTTYASGVRVMLNYNMHSYTLPNGTVLPPLGFFIERGER